MPNNNTVLPSVCNKNISSIFKNPGLNDSHSCQTSLHTTVCFPATKSGHEKTVTFEKTKNFMSSSSDSENNRRGKGVSVLRKTSFNSKQATPVLKRHDSFTKVINQAPMHPPSRQNRVIVELIRKLQNENKQQQQLNNKHSTQLDHNKIELPNKNKHTKNDYLDDHTYEPSSEFNCSKNINDNKESNLEQLSVRPTIDKHLQPEPPDTFLNTIATSKLSSITTISFDEIDVLSDESLSTDEEEDFIDSLIMNSPKINRKDQEKDEDNNEGSRKEILNPETVEESVTKTTSENIEPKLQSGLKFTYNLMHRYFLKKFDINSNFDNNFNERLIYLVEKSVRNFK